MSKTTKNNSYSEEYMRTVHISYHLGSISEQFGCE